LTQKLPRIVFFNINGSGMGHLSRCLAYARRLEGRARSIFFSLASAIEVIEDMGFEAEYFVSPFWSSSHINAWNRELAVRFGLLLDSVHPDAVVFDGTWPFHGFMEACDVYGVKVRVWSNRGLHKSDFEPVPVDESLFDLAIHPGEIGDSYILEREKQPGRAIRTSPVTIFDADELLSREDARRALGLDQKGRYGLFTLGPGNLKDVSGIAAGLITRMRSAGFDVVWARAPISVRDVELPDEVTSISAFPLVRYMRAFDVVLGAAGYNTCNEVVQAGIPALLIPNKLVADDQARRAAMTSKIAPVIVSPCETDEEQQEAVAGLVGLYEARPVFEPVAFDGAQRAVDEILALISDASRR
jgi:UDP:flavonoid glycosyltransferase YjiC (YdhE family)